MDNVLLLSTIAKTLLKVIVLRELLLVLMVLALNQRFSVHLLKLVVVMKSNVGMEVVCHP